MINGIIPFFASPYDSRKQQNTPTPNVDTRGSGGPPRVLKDGGLSGMVVDLLEPTHGPHVGSSARRNQDGSPPVKAGYWEAAARRLQKACKISVSSPGRKNKKCLVSKKVPFRGLWQKARNGLFFIEQIQLGGVMVVRVCACSLAFKPVLQHFANNGRAACLWFGHFIVKCLKTSICCRSNCDQVLIFAHCQNLTALRATSFPFTQNL